MPFDPEKVDPQHADLFYHGGPPDEDGTPRPLSDEQWDAQKARMTENGDWPFETKEEA